MWMRVTLVMGQRVLLQVALYRVKIMENYDPTARNPTLPIFSMQVYIVGLRMKIEAMLREYIYRVSHQVSDIRWLDFDL